MTAPAFVEECTKRGLLGDWMGPKLMRLVTHYGIDASDIQSTLKVCEDVLTS